MLILSKYFSKKLYLLYSQCSLHISLFIGSILVKLNSLKILDAQLWTKIQKVNKIIYFYFLTSSILKARNKKVLTVSTYRFSSVQSFSRVWLFVTPRTAAHQASLFITNSQTLLKLISIESVMPSNHLIFCHPLLLLPSIFPSIGVFSNESVRRIRWPTYWRFSFSISISPSNEYSRLISFRMNWLDLLTAQGTLKSLQHHSSKTSNLCADTYLHISNTEWV